MAEEKVKNATDATYIARNFVSSQGRGGGKERTAHRSGDVWIVEFDIGLFEPKTATVQIDARTGDVVGYAFPD